MPFIYKVVNDMLLMQGWEVGPYLGKERDNYVAFCEHEKRVLTFTANMTSMSGSMAIPNGILPPYQVSS